MTNKALMALASSLQSRGTRVGFCPYWRGVRVVEGARLESVYRLIAYRGFESRSLRQIQHTSKPRPCGVFV